MAMSLQGGWEIGGRTQVGTLRQPRYFLPPRRVFSRGEPLKDPLLAPQNTCWRPTTPLRIFVNQTNSLMHTSTKPTAYSALFALLLLGLIATPAQAQLGVSGGLNFESAGDIETMSSDATLDNSTGYHIGLVYELGLGPATIRPGFFYRRVGTFEFSSGALPQGEDQFDVSAWQVPVDLRFTVLPTPLVSPYVLAGPMATFPRGEGDFDDATEEISYSLNVGIGANISLPAVSLKIQPELRYEFGASQFIKDDFEIGDTSFEPQDSPSFSAFGLRVNVIF